MNGKIPEMQNSKADSSLQKEEPMNLKRSQYTLWTLRAKEKERLKTTGRSLRNLWDTGTPSIKPVYTLWGSQKEEREVADKILEKIIAETSQNLIKDMNKNTQKHHKVPLT